MSEVARRVDGSYYAGENEKVTDELRSHVITRRVMLIDIAEDDDNKVGEQLCDSGADAADARGG